MTVRSLFPILSTPDLAALSGFYERALGAEVVYRFPGDDGDVYVSLRLGSAALGIGADPGVDAVGDRIALWFYVDDVDSSFAAAIAAGAVEVRPPTDREWGERVGQVRDPDGNLVNIATEPPAQ